MESTLTSNLCLRMPPMQMGMQEARVQWDFQHAPGLDCRDLAIPCCLVQMPMMESSMQFGLQTPGKGWYIVTEAALRAKLHQRF